MKSKLLVAAMVCLALGACQKESNKETKSTTETTTTTTPAHPENAPANPGHSMYENENATHIAADDQNAQPAPSTTDQDMTNKAQDMKQDSANTVNQTGTGDQTQTTTTTEPTQNTDQGSTDHTHQ